MSRSLVVSVVASLLAVSAHSQQVLPPAIEWQRVFGGFEREFLYAVEQTSEGGFLLGGSSESPPGGNKTASNYGSSDYWIVRLDAQGDYHWDQGFGGFRGESIRSLQETIDGGFIVGGGSKSDADGNKTTPHFGTYATSDFWVIRLDPSGNKLWEQNVGGTSDDPLRKAEQTADGGFFLCGGSASTNSGNKVAARIGGYDFWAVRLNSSGQKLWDKSYGGAYDDLEWDAQLTADGGLILGGASISQPSGSKSSTNYGDYDFWIVRLDADGNKLWDRSFGGIYDDTLYCLKQAPDGGFVLAGRSLSPPGGNKTARYYGGADFWVVRTDTNGNKLWDLSFGGTEDEYPYSVAVTTDGGVIVGGWSNSGISGNKTTPSFGGSDFWVVRLDADGNKLWEAVYGGSRTDQLQCLRQTRDGGFILGGTSSSPADGNKTAPDFFFGDFWVIKLGPEQPQLSFLDPPFGAAGLQLSLAGIKNVSYSIDCSTNLETWTPWRTNRLSGPMIEILDSSATNAAQRFYRARTVP